MKLFIGIIQPDNSIRLKTYHKVGNEVTIDGNTYLIEGSKMIHRNISFNRTVYYMFFFKGNPKALEYDKTNEIDYRIIQTLLQDHTAKDILGKAELDKTMLYMYFIMGLVFGAMIVYIFLTTFHK